MLTFSLLTKNNRQNQIAVADAISAIESLSSSSYPPYLVMMGMVGNVSPRRGLAREILGFCEVVPGECQRQSKKEPQERERKEKKESNHSKITNAFLIASTALHIDTSKRLGAGGFGVVYQGTWQKVNVAVKQLHTTSLSAEILHSFMEEAEHHVALRHPNIVTLWGVCVEPAHMCMVMELMTSSLYHLLHSHQDLPWTMRLSIAKHITIGLDYLHQRFIIHRDLKSLNVLLDQHGQAKLADFGLSTAKSETTRTTRIAPQPSAPAPGTTCWMAPELFARGSQCTTASDFYALGMIFLEITRRKAPFEDEKHATEAMIIEWIKNGELDIIPKDCPPKFSALITHCLMKNPVSRPSSAEDISETLLQADIIEVPSKNSEMVDPGYRWKS